MNCHVEGLAQRIQEFTKTNHHRRVLWATLHTSASVVKWGFKVTVAHWEQQRQRQGDVHWTLICFCSKTMLCSLYKSKNDLSFNVICLITASQPLTSSENINYTGQIVDSLFRKANHSYFKVPFIIVLDSTRD